MNENESEIITDEELDEISGGIRSYVFEKKHDPVKGDYYKCTTTDGLRTLCIGADRWADWLKAVKKRGDTINPK